MNFVLPSDWLYDAEYNKNYVMHIILCITHIASYPICEHVIKYR